MKDIELADELHLHDPAQPPMTGVLTSINAPIAHLCMMLSVGGLFFIVAIVFWQVFGRYVFNSSPTWTESLALVLVLYVTLIGVAVGVRHAGHIGMESLLVLLSERIRNRIELAIHVLGIVFGAAMIYNGALLGASVWTYKIPNLGLPEAVRYLPLVISSVLVISFSVEHLLALVQGTEVVPSWH